MRTNSFDRLLSGLSAARAARPVGRVAAIEPTRLVARGLAAEAGLGDRVSILSETGPIGGEVAALSEGSAVVLAEGPLDSVRLHDPVELVGADALAPSDAWIGRVIDPFGQPLDGRPLARGAMMRPLRAPPPAAVTRRRLGARLPTGMAAFDTLLPIVRGQRVGLFAGSGVGKSSLLARFATGVAADVAVIALIGERGREVREFVEATLGPDGLARSVVVAATSDRPALVRRRCAWAALTVAEHFRDTGRHVLLLADSVTRFAEAHREAAVAAGEGAGLRGFPPSTAHQIMALAERAGPGPDDGRAGDITAVFSVLVAGSDFDEPVADILRGTLDGHVLLDRAIAERGRFPAVDAVRSVSRSLPRAAREGENRLIADARACLAAQERAELMVRAGLYAEGSDPVTDRALRLFPALDGFLAEASAGPEDAFARLGAILAG